MQSILGPDVPIPRIPACVPTLVRQACGLAGDAEGRIPGGSI